VQGLAKVKRQLCNIIIMAGVNALIKSKVVFMLGQVIWLLAFILVIFTIMKIVNEISRGD